MTEITRHRPPGGLSELLEWFGDLPTMREWSRAAFGNSVRIEDCVEEDRYVLRAELPGLDPDKDVEITVVDGVLTISGQRQARTEQDGRSEFHYGSFMRRVALPAGAREDDLAATYRDGILEVTVPITPGQPEPRRIPVARAATK
jgi:HSP20 family protein